MWVIYMQVYRVTSCIVIMIEVDNFVINKNGSSGYSWRWWLESNRLEAIYFFYPCKIF